MSCGVVCKISIMYSFVALTEDGPWTTLARVVRHLSPLEVCHIQNPQCVGKGWKDHFLPRLGAGAMSSFSSLRSERKSKESKSFVSGNMCATASSGVVQSLEETSESTELVKKTNEPQTESLYATLPWSLEIRTAPSDGRGIWGRETLSTGVCSLFSTNTQNIDNLELFQAPRY